MSIDVLLSPMLVVRSLLCWKTLEPSFVSVPKFDTRVTSPACFEISEAFWTPSLSTLRLICWNDMMDVDPPIAEIPIKLSLAFLLSHPLIKNMGIPNYIIE